MSKRNFEKEKNFISVVVYMKNVEKTIENFLFKVDNLLNENFQAYEYVLVDDYSEDNTIVNVNKIKEQINGNLSIIKMAYPHGLEKSIFAGIDLAIGDFVYEFDTTLINYDISLILDLYYTSMKGFDVVVATDEENKKKSSKLFYNYLNKVSYKNMKLTTETFRIISRRAINRVSRNKGRIEYRKALYHYSGFNTKVVTYKPINNVQINNGLTFRQRSTLALDILLNYSDIGIRLAGIVSGFFLLLAGFSLLYTIHSYLTVENIQPGWSTTMLFLTASFGGVFLVLSIISKYLVNILIEVREQPLYIYKSIEKM